MTRLGHGDAMDAVEAAFTAAARWTDGSVDYTERSRNTTYAARMLLSLNLSYVDAVDALARAFSDPAEIAALPRRAARARS